MERNNNFTIVHILGALLVIIGHQFVLMGVSVPPLLNWLPHDIGVKVLFLVSGYLISMSYLRKRSRVEYLVKRVSRLYPALIAYLMVAVVVFYFFTTEPTVYWASAKQYVLNNLAMRPVFAMEGVLTTNISPAINGSLWTLPVELICYIAIIPVLDIYKLVEKKSSVAAKGGLVAFILALSAFVWYYQTYMAGTVYVVWGTDLYSVVPLLLWFLVGCAYYVLDLKKYCNLQLAGVLILLFTLLAGKLRDVLMPYFLSYLVMSFALTEKPFFAKTIKHDVCYGLYLFSFPVQQLLISWLQGKPGWNAYTGIILATAISWVLAELTFRFVEHPVAQKVNALLKKIGNS